MPRQFNGVIDLDIRKSKGDWDAFLEPRAAKDAPNVLVILYDDTGQATWSPYGGRVEMPTLDRLAKNGLIYSQWHTTSVCSPTRSCFLTGRNHHANGFGTIAESAVGFPGYSGHIPLENATMATVLRDAGWSTFWIGKNHNVPVDAFDMGSSKKRWPLGLGYDRFYGFIGGETNQWYPELLEDNHFVDQPYQPEEGYHLSKDLADKAVTFIRDARQSQPDKPWYLWFCPGANHAPHHAPKEYIDKYKGKFDDGYEAYREWVLPRMIERGILPKDTQLTPINPMSPGMCPEGDMVRPWNTLSADEKKLFSRMAEVFAGFSEYTDAQVGRLVDYLEETGQLECCGVAMPEVVDGVKQSPLAGVSMRYSFDNGAAPTTKETQCYEMISTRGIWHKGWKASTEHAPFFDKGHFDTEPWQLFHVDEDRSESRDLAAQHPDKVKALSALWLSEAKKNNVLPLNDLGFVAFRELEYKVKPPATGRYVYYPGTTEVPEASAARTLGSSFKILAEVELTKDSKGVIFSQGSRFGGYTLFVKDGALTFVYNFLGIEEQKLTGPLPAPGKHIVGVDFARERFGQYHEGLGPMKLYVDDKVAAEAAFRTQSGHYAICGEGLCIGRDSGDPVSREYPARFVFEGGTVVRVVYDVNPEDVYVDLEQRFAAAMARD